MESIFSVLIGFVLAWIILGYFPVQQPKVSYFTLHPWPLELDDSNLALIGVGLASPKPKPSVMDASPASSAEPVMMSPAPSPASVAKSVMMTPAPSPTLTSPSA